MARRPLARMSVATCGNSEPAYRCADAGYGSSGLRHFLDRPAVDAGLAAQIIDGDVGVVPGQPGADPETFGQLRNARFGKPGLRRCTAVPVINPAGAALPVPVT